MLHTSDRDIFPPEAGHTGDIPWHWHNAVPTSHPWSFLERASSLRGEATALLHTDRVCGYGGDGGDKAVVIVMVVMVCEFREKV